MCRLVYLCTGSHIAGLHIIARAHISFAYHCAGFHIIAQARIIARADISLRRLKRGLTYHCAAFTSLRGLAHHYCACTSLSPSRVHVTFICAHTCALLKHRKTKLAPHVRQKWHQLTPTAFCVLAVPFAAAFTCVLSLMVHFACCLCVCSSRACNACYCCISSS